VKYYIISGEASGDLHASNLIKELNIIDNNAEFRFWGGDLMAKQANGTLVKHYKDLAFMGFVDVLLNIFTIFKNLKFCKKDIKIYAPDVLILVDYPGFNLRIAKFAKKINLKVFYYISPQIWAWKQSRIKIIKRYVDKMFVILPFEQDFYNKFNYKVDFAGHPLLDAIEEKIKTKISFDEFIKINNLKNKPIIAILPGSRKQEIKKMLPQMLCIENDFKDYQFIVAGTSSIEKEFYDKYIGENTKIIYNETYNLLEHSDAAIVTSGTATLETALLNIPEIVCYKAGNLSFFIAKKLVKVKYISLVNLIVDKEIVRELIQKDLNIKNLTIELDKILNNKEHRENLFNEYKLLKLKLGGSGASERFAKSIYNYLKS